MQTVIQNSETGKAWIKESVSKGIDSAVICSAYIRSEAFKFLFHNIFDSGIPIRVLARWAPGDIIAQSSDLMTYELCRSKNIDFYIKQDFHGKLYWMAPHGILIGSFNLTNRGFSIFKAGNDEAGVLIENSDQSTEYFDRLFKGARKVDDLLYEQMRDFVERNSQSETEGISWPKEILESLSPASYNANERILVNECMASNFSEFLTSSSHAREHDLSLLSIDERFARDISVLRSRFVDTKIFRWFYATIRDQKGAVYFGQATALLHDQLFDDPKPYRQEVKFLLANLLSWIEGLGLEGISIDRPNHSQRIFLNQ
jgi:hypothetical protein